MKNIVIILICSFLVGCTTLKTAFNLKEHDPTLSLAYVDTKISFDDAYCDEYETLEAALYQSIWMHEYTIFVNDTQKGTAKAIVSDINNALDYSFDNVDVCSRFLKLAKLKLKTLQKTWGSR
tara:strand:+ start:145 stop:510 length:366 start_codon:yes stop_codon:yes gene_type:complete